MTNSEQQQAPAAPRSGLLARLLTIAERYRAEGAHRQAVPIYFELAEGHPETAEGQSARQALLEVGEWYERNGEFRQARSLYERLL
jgi:hypothetical protein